MRVRLGLVSVFALSVACGRPHIVFPVGAGVPVPDSLQVWWTATDACKNAQTFSAEIHVDGHVAEEKLRRVTLQGAMTRKREIRLLAVAPAGAPIFTLAGTDARAVLTMPHDKRVVIAPAADIMEALIGVRLTPDDWLDVLSGCVSSAHPDSATRINDVMIMALERDGGRLRLDKDGAGWRIVAGERPNLLVEYEQFLGRWPSAVKLSSRAGAPVEVSLNMSISQQFVNTDLPARTFVADVPPDYRATSLAELRAMGPLGSGEPLPAPQGRR